jgi:hypothetical protein
MILKTIVNKNGKLEDYLHLPLMNRDFTYPVGAIIGAEEIESGYELTIAMFKSN